MEKLRILLVDDHAVLRAGLRLLIDRQPDMIVIGEADTGEAARQVAHYLQPDVVLMDISMPGMDGLEAMRLIKRDLPGVKMLVLTMHEDEDYLRQALSSGAAGYVPKSAADTEVISALRAVARGGVYIHPSHAKMLIEGMLPTLESPGGGRQYPHHATLSDREREVLRLVALGHTNNQIAEQMFISVKTVESYRARVMEKLGLRNRAALVRYALEHGLVDDNE
ncbi:MAG: response regulator transcription factor [Chloroflexi bacterium]|nr:response regulator transcription factor [Chloroflexota bacterium]